MRDDKTQRIPSNKRFHEVPEVVTKVIIEGGNSNIHIRADGNRAMPLEVERYIPKGEGGHTILSGDRVAHLNVYGEGYGHAERKGRGYGHAHRSGSGPGDARRTGPGDGDAIRTNAGNGNAERLGSGAGEAAREGSGDGDAINNSGGDGNALRTGDGNGSAYRLGPGDGDACRHGQGTGDAIRAGSGEGYADNTSLGNGNAIRAGFGNGDAYRDAVADGKAYHLSRGLGVAMPSVNKPPAKPLETEAEADGDDSLESMLVEKADAEARKAAEGGAERQMPTSARKLDEDEDDVEELRARLQELREELFKEQCKGLYNTHQAEIQTLFESHVSTMLSKLEREINRQITENREKAEIDPGDIDAAATAFRIDEFRQSPRWCAIGKTDIEKGFLALIHAARWLDDEDRPRRYNGYPKD